MIQVHSKNYQNVLFGGTQFVGVINGQGAGVNANQGIIPIPIDCIVRNLSIVCPRSGHAGIQATIQRSTTTSAGLADTSVGVLSAGGDLTVQTDIINEALFEAGDLIACAFTGIGQTLGNAPPVGLSLEMEAQENIYGIGTFSGSINIGEARYGGILGNGIYSTFGGNFATPSNSRSICALNGSITRLCAYTDQAPGTGVWTSYLIKNGVLQDGTGGTVDTSVVLTGSTVFAVSTFTLDVAIQDVLDVYCIRSGSNGAFTDYNVGNSITFDPEIPGLFMFCGGNNAAISVGEDYRWVDAEQNQTPEEYNSGLVGPSGISVRGMYIERTIEPGAGETITHTLRQDLLDTGLQVVLVDNEQTGEDNSGVVTFPADSLIDIACIGSAGASNGGQLHWAIPVSLVVAPEGVLGPIAWMEWKRAIP